jgi:hypothetical protein
MTTDAYNPASTSTSSSLFCAMLPFVKGVFGVFSPDSAYENLADGCKC